jgi:hypothetical protein
VSKSRLADASVLAGAIGTILVAAGAWLLFPRERPGAKPTLPPLRVCLVDVSASVTLRRPWFGWIEKTLEEQAAAAAGSGEDLCTILFGKEIRRAYGPGPSHDFDVRSAIDPRRMNRSRIDETRLASALETVRALAREPARAGCRLVYVGDDTFTGPDPRPIWRELADLGVNLERVQLPPAEGPQVLPGPLTLPREVEPGAPISLDAEVFASPAPEVVLHLAWESASSRNEKTLTLEVPRGLAPDADGYVRWRIHVDLGRAEPGLTSVRLESSEGFVRCRGRAIVGVVAAGHPLVAGARPEALFSIPSSSGIQLESIWPEELASRLDSLDALVTCDVPPDRLPADVLSTFLVHGGGWLCLAGDRFLPGLVAGRAPEFLPLQPPDENPDPRDVVVIVDRSGSMAGEPYENVGRALLSLVDAAPERDAVEVRFLGESLSDPVSLKAAFDRRPRDQLLRDAADRFHAAGGPGGRTAIARSMERFAADRERSGREALVFLLTDGRDTVDADATARCAKILPRLLAARTRVVVIAAGDAPERELLSSLVAPEERLWSLGVFGVSSSRLAEIFRREVTADRTREGPELRVLTAQKLLDPTALPSLGSDVLRAQAGDASADWPSIQRYARAKPAPGAEVLWSSEKGEPLLAIQRVGAGASAACAFAPIAAWGPDWSKRADLWAPLLRALARGKREPLPAVHVEEDELTVEDLPTDAPADLEARIFAADAWPGAPPAVVLMLSAPTQGVDPRRVRTARWPHGGVDLRGDADLRQGIGLDDPILPRLEIRSRGSSDASWPAIVLPFPAPRAPEFVLPRSRMDWSRAAPLPSVPAGPARSPRAHPSAPWVLFSGLLLLAIAGLVGAFARRSR